MHQVNLVNQVKLDHQVPVVHKDLLDLRVHLETQDRLVQKVLRVPPDSQDYQGVSESLVHQGLRVMLEGQECQDHLDSQDHRVILDHKVTLDLLETLDSQVRWL